MSKFFKYFGIVPIVCLNLVPLYGVFALGWKIADIFFWYWFEFLTASLFAYMALRSRWKVDIENKLELKEIEKKEFLMFFILFFFYATLFMLVAVMGDLVGEVKSFTDYLVFWDFILAKMFMMFVILFAGLINFWQENIADKTHLNKIFEQITEPLRKKAFVIGIFYFILIIQYHISSPDTIPSERWYLYFEVAALVTARIIVDTVSFYKDYEHQRR